MLNQKRSLRTGLTYWQSRPCPRIPVAPLIADRTTEVIVIGAGMTGAMAAEALTAAGLRVTLVDRRGPFQGATAATTALLQYEIDTPLTVLQHTIGHADAARAWRRSKINYHPQSGWFEDTPLKGGTEQGYPLKGVHERTSLSRLRSLRGTTIELLWSPHGIGCPLSVALRVALGAFPWPGKRGSTIRRPALPLNAGTAEPFRVSPPEAVAYPLELGLESLAAKVQALGIRCAYTRVSSLYLAGTLLDADGLAHECQARNTIGLHTEYLTRQALQARGDVLIQLISHSIELSGERIASYGEGHSTLDFPLIHDTQSQDQS